MRATKIRFALLVNFGRAQLHILVIDDVITTGATLCSLIDVMESDIPNIKVSVFTLAIAY